jgi:hypothetical protein
MDTLEQRLRRLESEVTRTRRLNRLLVLAAVVIMCVAGAQSQVRSGARLEAQQQSQQASGNHATDENPLGPNATRTIEAAEFILRDPKGRVRATLNITDGGPALCMLDERGKKRLELCQTNRAVGLQLFHPAEAPAVLLQLPHGVEPGRLEMRNSQGASLTRADGLFINDAAGNSRLQLALLNGNFPMLGISRGGQSGPPSIELTASGGSPSVKLHDVDGRPLFSLISADGGRTLLNMTHPDHERSLQIATGPSDSDSPTITLFAPARADGTGGLLPRLRLGLQRDGQPYARSTSTDGRTTSHVP